MDTGIVNLYIFPELSPNASGWDYFWLKFPFAFPGILTLILGITSAIFVLVRILTSSQNRFFFISILGVILGCTSFAFLNSLRAVVQDLDALLSFHYKFYYLALILGPSTNGFLFFLLEKRSKLPLFFVLANIILMVPCYLALYQGNAFKGDFINYQFGNFATAETPLKLWAILNAISYFIHLPKLISIYKNQKVLEKNLYFHFAFHLVTILTLSAIPSLVGKPIYPGGHFYFIPSLLLCYAIIRDSYKIGKEFLFEKRGIFYIVSGVTGFFLSFLAIGFSLFLKPDLSTNHYTLYILPPLVSTLFAYMIASYIAGINPEKEFNIYGALSLVSAGSMQIILVLRTLDLPVLLHLRIEQVLYIPFAFTISFFYRFIHLAMKLEIPKYIKYVDAFSVFIALSSLTPWMFAGYYEYPFGRYLKSGVSIQLLGILVIYFNLNLLWKYLQIRKLNILSKSENQLIIYYFLFSSVILLNLPATSGIRLYPLSNLNFIPFWFIGINVIRIGAKEGH